MSESTEQILNRIHQYINSSNFKGDGEDRRAGSSAINHIVEGGLDKLNGLSEDEILSHVSRMSVSVPPASHSTMGGQIGMVAGIPSTLIEAGIRIKDKGLKQGLKETGQAYVGSRPYELGESARLITDIAAPFLAPRLIKSAVGGARSNINRLVDAPRQARISHIGKTKAKFRFQKDYIKYSGMHGGSSISTPKSNDLQSAYNRMVNAPAQWPTIKKKASKIIQKVDPISKHTYTGLSKSIRTDINNIIKSKSKVKSKSIKIDKLLSEYYHGGQLKNTEVRAFNVYAADKLKSSLPVSRELSTGKNINKLSVGKGVSKKVSRGIKERQLRAFKNQKPQPAPVKPQPSPKPTPEEQVGSKFGSLIEQIYNEKMAKLSGVETKLSEAVEKVYGEVAKKLMKKPPVLKKNIDLPKGQDIIKVK